MGYNGDDKAWSAAGEKTRRRTGRDRNDETSGDDSGRIAEHIGLREEVSEGADGFLLGTAGQSIFGYT